MAETVKGSGMPETHPAFLLQLWGKRYTLWLKLGTSPLPLLEILTLCVRGWVGGPQAGKQGVFYIAPPAKIQMSLIFGNEWFLNVLSVMLRGKLHIHNAA